LHETGPTHSTRGEIPPELRHFHRGRRFPFLAIFVSGRASDAEPTSVSACTLRNAENARIILDRDRSFGLVNEERMGPRGCQGSAAFSCFYLWA
jgi:hypothetical protein